MCAERVARIPSIIMMFVILYFISANIVVAEALIVFVAAMMTVWALFDFCPSIWLFSKFLPKCYCECDKKDNSYE